MLTLTIRNTVNRSVGHWLFSSFARTKEQVDPQQEAALKERCFLVDVNDKVTGHASKKDCHLVQADGSILLHRAFSVFLFNQKGDLLLQKRSAQKVRISS